MAELGITGQINSPNFGLLNKIRDDGAVKLTGDPSDALINMALHGTPAQAGGALQQLDQITGSREATNQRVHIAQFREELNIDGLQDVPVTPITADQIRQIMPNAGTRADTYVDALNQAMTSHGINTPEQRADICEKRRFAPHE